MNRKNALTLWRDFELQKLLYEFKSLTWNDLDKYFAHKVFKEFVYKCLINNSKTGVYWCFT